MESYRAVSTRTYVLAVNEPVEFSGAGVRGHSALKAFSMGPMNGDAEFNYLHASK
jgi:hypothetical protein